MDPRTRAARQEGRGSFPDAGSQNLGSGTKGASSPLPRVMVPPALGQGPGTWLSLGSCCLQPGLPMLDTARLGKLQLLILAEDTSGCYVTKSECELWRVCEYVCDCEHVTDG